MRVVQENYTEPGTHVVEELDSADIFYIAIDSGQPVTITIGEEVIETQGTYQDLDPRFGRSGSVSIEITAPTAIELRIGD